MTFIYHLLDSEYKALRPLALLMAIGFLFFLVSGLWIPVVNYKNERAVKALTKANSELIHKVDSLSVASKEANAKVDSLQREVQTLLLELARQE
nr:MAG TPA: hypothetical protein [Caudoviricetes sp.]